MARLIESLATTDQLAELFSDQSLLQALLDFEIALARAQARVGIIPLAAAESIAAAAKAEAFDIAALSHDMLRAGTAGVPLAKALTNHVRAKDEDAARYVHWGATSQDVADTALVLLLKRAQNILLGDISKLEQSLARLSDEHSKTVMLGRTLMQGAPPITFGLKAAGWLGAVHRCRERLDSSFAAVSIVQFGGASGTLAALGEQGTAVAVELAKELGLGCPEAPWHTHRDRLANVICDCGVLTGSLGKIARDIGLLMQNEVAEVAEPGGQGRGGSSTMPHKRNPIGSALTLAAAQRVPGEVAAFLSAMVQEHERGVGGWQTEWPIVASVIQSTGLAAASMAEVIDGLSVDAARMRANIDTTHGLVFAERAMMLLARKLGRDAAHTIVEEATRKSAADGRNLSEILAEMHEVTAHVDVSALRQLQVPEQYLGSAEIFRKALVSSARNSKKER
ncbi:MAG: 3-carboxy-cis,cis-muconate cycloisomerase [Candidatus Sulfotelmatobacter sp.]